MVHWAAVGGHVSVLKFLQTKKYDVKSLTSKEESTLHLAADHGNLEAVKWLVKQVSISLRDNNGRTAEDLAKLEGHKEIVAHLQSIEASLQTKVTSCRITQLIRH